MKDRGDASDTRIGRSVARFIVAAWLASLFFDLAVFWPAAVSCENGRSLIAGVKNLLPGPVSKASNVPSSAIQVTLATPPIFTIATGFGTFSVIALAVNLLLLISVLSMLQATLTLPGIAAMALALGMAIDSHVLINERIREELRNGAAPQTAIAVGFDKAWATILDSNVTTLIAGLALLAFGSGPIKGFAVVHCLGILTSMFSAVFFSRGLVNLWYGRHKKVQKLAIGQVWRPQEK